MTKAPAYCVDRVRHHYTFNILANNTPLMTNPEPEPGAAHIAGEANVPAWIRRRAFDVHKVDYYGEVKSLYIWRDRLDKPVPIGDIVPADLSFSSSSSSSFFFGSTFATELALRQAGIEIVLWNFLVYQVLVAIDTRRTFRLHFRMCSLG